MIVLGRAAFERRAWGQAFEHLSAEPALPPEDLRRLATAAYLSGHHTASVQAWERAHDALLESDDRVGAAGCAFWLAFALIYQGQLAVAGGWLARAARLLDEDGSEGPQRDYLLLPEVLRHIAGEDYASAFATAERAAESGTRFGDADLICLARHLSGRALIRQGRIHDGVALLDEVMLAVSEQQVSPIVAGTVYCGVIDGCREVFDLRRAREWTVALAAWCDQQSDLVPYHGECRLHRAEIMMLHGDWADAQDEIVAARRRDGLTGPAVGTAHYLQAELHRLRGEFPAAEADYRAASASGHYPQPGMALLRLAQGEVAPAVAAIRRVLSESAGSRHQPLSLAAAVEILLADGEAAEAEAAAKDLAASADAIGAPVLRAMATQASGAVHLAKGDLARAGARLRRAWADWHALGSPYQAARTRLLLAQVSHAAGDEEAARLESELAQHVFHQLGAASPVDLAKVRRQAGPLTGRELEVLRLVADGRTNRDIAARLVLSEKTVDRHVSNILAKLQVRSRAAATSYAFQHRLL